MHVPAAVLFAQMLLLLHCSDAYICCPLHVSGAEPWREMESVGGIGLAHTLAHHSLCSTAMLHLIEVSRACWASSLSGRTVSVSAIRPDGHACFHHRRAQLNCLWELGRPCSHARGTFIVVEAPSVCFILLHCLSWVGWPYITP